MVWFDLAKYAPTEQFKKNDKPCYLCAVRKKHICITPEEKVRQAFINYLVTEKGFPIKDFRIEVPISKYKAGAPGRADIIIEDAWGYPLVLVECKDGSTVITEKDGEQINRYNDILNASAALVMVNGSQIVMIVYTETEEGYSITCGNTNL